MSVIKWWWFDTTHFGVVCYTVVDYQKNKEEGPDKNSELPLERKLSFDFCCFFLFLFLSTEESIWCMRTLFGQAHRGS